MSSGWHLHQSLSRPEDARQRLRRHQRDPVGDRQPLHGRPARTCTRRRRLQHTDAQWLQALSSLLARARPRHLGPRQSRRDGARAGRTGRSGDASREPRRRAPRQSLLYMASQIVCGLDGNGARAGPRAVGRQTLRGQRAAAAAFARRGTGGAEGEPGVARPGSATSSSTTTRASSRPRSTASSWKSATGEQREYFSLFLIRPSGSEETAMSAIAYSPPSPTARTPGSLAGRWSKRSSPLVRKSPGIESVYTWKGTVESGKEYRILFKTLDEHYPRVERAILELHPYEVPRDPRFPDGARLSGLRRMDRGRAWPSRSGRSPAFRPALLHFFRTYDFLRRGEEPAIAEGTGDHAGAVAVELVLHRRTRVAPAQPRARRLRRRRAPRCGTQRENHRWHPGSSPRSQDIRRSSSVPCRRCGSRHARPGPPARPAGTTPTAPKTLA